MPAAVLLDSSADIDFIQAEGIGVDLLMRTVEFRGEGLLGLDDISPHELFDAIDAGAEYPKNSVVGVPAYTRMLERMLGRASHVLALHPSPHMSGNLAVARKAAAQFPGKVTVLEAGTISSGIALQARWMATQLRAGLYPTNVAAMQLEKRQQQRTLVWMPSVQRFQIVSQTGWNQGISPDASVVVSNPGAQARILTAAQHDRTTHRVIQQYLRRYANAMPKAHVTFFHCGAEEKATELAERAADLGLQPLWTVPMGLSLSAHLGLGAYGFSLLPE